MYATINPSVTITPVYNTTKHKQKCATSLPVSAVTVQVEPVDLSTRPTQHLGPGKGLWEFRTFLDHGAFSFKALAGTTHVQDNVEDERDREKVEKINDWSKNKKIHRCGHPGCEKVRHIDILRKNNQTDNQKVRQKNRQKKKTDRQTNRDKQTDIKKYKQSNRQTDKQTNRHKSTN